MKLRGGRAPLWCQPEQFRLWAQLDQDHIDHPWPFSTWQDLENNTEHQGRYALYWWEKGQGQVLGFALFYLLPEEEALHLLKVLVLSEFRSQGIGSRLLHASIENLKQHFPFQKMFLEVATTNTAALKLYDQWPNWPTAGEVRVADFYGAGAHAFRYIKSL